MKGKAMRGVIAIALLPLSLGLLSAAAPPDRVNYQGILRDSAGAPRNGSFDVSFHLYDALTGGNEILIDRHLAANSQAVVVTTGLFNVEIGSGQMLDGSGPGTFTTLGAAFGSQASLFLEIEIAGETLAPRLHVAAAGYALNAATLTGRAATEFLDTSATAQTKAGQLNLSGASVPSGQGPLISTGEIGAHFASTLGAWAEPGRYSDGLWATGTGTGSGGVFYSFGGTAVGALGATSAGYFQNLNQPSWAYLAKGDIGVYSQGVNVGGWFQTPGSVSWALLAQGIWGLQAGGTATTDLATTTSAARFSIRNSEGTAVVATADLAAGWRNSSTGTLYSYGGIFENLLNGNYCELAGTDGISANGDWSGGLFTNSYGSMLKANDGDAGLSAFGNSMGGYFADWNSSGSGRVAYGTYKIQGTGSVAFVQNHPTDKGKVIVYNSPEGDEVATYTRGSGRLVGGEARIPLGETFAWVTNPDLGLTAHVTPRDEAVALAVVSVTTKELVVRGPEDARPDLAFDYIVYGLRIGFEETSIVQEKQEEAYIPSMADHRRRYEDHPELRRFNALERVEATRQRMGSEAAPNLSAATALKNAIHEFDPKVDVMPAARDRDRLRPGPGRAANAAAGRVLLAPGPPENASASDSLATPRAAQAGSAGTAVVVLGSTHDRDGSVSSTRAPGDGVARVETLRVSEPVRAGDLLAVDPTQPDRVRRAEGVGDPAFIGVAQTDSEDGEVELATARVLRVQADAGYGAIALGDLVTTSPTPGAAMRAIDPAPGTAFGKALDSLESGIAEIRVLWMPR
jgi:hypothetical protein